MLNRGSMINFALWGTVALGFLEAAVIASPLQEKQVRSFLNMGQGQ